MSATAEVGDDVSRAAEFESAPPPPDTDGISAGDGNESSGGRAIKDSTITDGLLDKFLLEAQDFTGIMGTMPDDVGVAGNSSQLVPLAIELARFGELFPETLDASSIIICKFEHDRDLCFDNANSAGLDSAFLNRLPVVLEFAATGVVRKSSPDGETPSDC